MKLMHVGLIVADLKASASSYEDVLGMKRKARPDLGFDGIFYRLAGNQELHLMLLPNPYQNVVLPMHGGRDRHVAFQVNDLAKIRRKLGSMGIAYTMSKSGRTALFCRDPDGNAVELCEAT
ncbi:MAG: VOC family protein [Mariprofundaceae bacterium]|nr:VOC family protein [Mariprofundaceae bacterium]